MTATFNPNAFSCIIAGDESLTIACGDRVLSGGHRVAAVVTRDADVRAWAQAQDLAVHGDFAALVAAAPACDWLLSIANLRIIPDAALALPGKGAINFHDGPLPRYAGLNTPAWAIINGEAEHGVSWHMIEGGVDEGDLLAQEGVEIAEGETAFTLNSKCYAAGMESFGRVLTQLESGAPERTAQDLSQRSYFARDDRPVALGLIDFTRTAAQIDALLRGLDFGDYWNPLGLAKIAAGDAVFAVGAAEVAEGQGAPGTVLAVGDDTLTVACAGGAVRLTGLRALAVGPLPGAGSVLDTAAGLDDAATALLRDEAYWRARLTRMAPLALPLVQGAPVGRYEKRRVPLAGGDATVALCALAQLSAGDRSVDIAQAIAPAEPRFAAAWVPLRCDGDLAAQAARIAATGGFARDLPLRDPAITQARPDLILADGPVEGFALTASFGAESITLHGDTGALSAQAMDLLAARLAHLLGAVLACQRQRPRAWPSGTRPRPPMTPRRSILPLKRRWRARPTRRRWCSRIRP
ncbi:formyltransferase family protein [Sulfitobacter albidus]|uniref:formyltransferase family protein n=1 Tax=Sulfitobacter albidus TaxID=2829501 RepID=UPI003D684576